MSIISWEPQDHRGTKIFYLKNVLSSLRHQNVIINTILINHIIIHKIILLGYCL